MRGALRNSILLLALWLSAAVWATDSDIVINEIHYHPNDNDPRMEYVELYNRGAAEVDLSGWRFSRGIDFTFPPGARLAPDAYLVLASDPGYLAAQFGISNVTGPFSGQLSNRGEQLRLDNSQGALVDQVRYEDRGDWPVAPDGAGSSLELLNPHWPNDLPDNWRGSGQGADSDWQIFTFQGRGTVGGSTGISYFYVYLRSAGQALVDEIEVVRAGTTVNSIGDGSFDAGLAAWQVSGNHAGSRATTQESYRGAGALHLVATGAGSSRTNNLWQDPMAVPVVVGEIYHVTMWVKFLTPGVALEARFSGSVYGDPAGLAGRLSADAPGSLLTPGRVNRQRTDNLPPYISGVGHTPYRPRSSDAVVIRCNLRDDSGPIHAATVYYQVSPPGGYIRISDPAYENEWTAVPLRDDGVAPDLLAGDGSFAAALPPTPHRHLVRYRVFAEDALGKRERSPHFDDPQPNHAYFVYDGTEDYDIPTYWMIGNEDDIFEAKYNGIHSNEYKWRVSLVYDGRVYDHVYMRLRGGVNRFNYLQRAWRYKMLIGHRFQGRDNDGTFYPYERKRVNLGTPHMQPGRLMGESGIAEWLSYRLFERMGVMSCQVSHVQLNVIDSPKEFGQYDGDWYGIYLDIEAPYDDYVARNGRPPEGNLYKVNNEPTADFDKKTNTWNPSYADVLAFRSGYRTSPSLLWFQNNLNIETYVEYRSITRLIQSTDVITRNIYYYRNPETNLWEETPWDLDCTFGAKPSGSDINETWRRFSSVPELKLRYDNRCRELLQFLFTREYLDPILHQRRDLLLETAAADRLRWDYAPLINGIGRTTPLELMPAHGKYRSLPERIEQIKEWIPSWRQTVYGQLNDPNMPQTPGVGRPAAAMSVDGVRLASSPFRHARTGAQFAASRFIIIEAGGDWLEPIWDSGALAPGQVIVDVSAGALLPGRSYQARVRHCDETGRWGWWSEPTGFETEAPPAPTPTPTPPDRPPVWFAPKALLLAAGSGQHDGVLDLKQYVSDDYTPVGNLLFSLVSQSDPAIVSVSVTPSGVLSATVQGSAPGISLVVVAVGDGHGNVSQTTIQVVVGGATAVPPEIWQGLR